MSDFDETSPDPAKFDFSAFPDDTLFLDRRTLPERRDRPKAVAKPPAAPPERRARKERRRRVDPTTFEKQYTEDEIQFMNAVQEFKNRSGKSFPSHGDILRVAAGLGYRKESAFDDDGVEWAEVDDSTSREVEPSVPA